MRLGELLRSIVLLATIWWEMLRHLWLVIGERVRRQIVYAVHDNGVGAFLDEAIPHELVREGGAAS